MMATITLLLHLLVVLALSLRASCIVILVPLYQYPSTTPKVAWQPLYNAIASNPKVKWQIIINPNSGPGPNLCPGATGNYEATTEYQSSIARLHSYPNVVLVGYVATTYGRKPIANVKAEISVYASWAKCPGVNVAINGIFFDEVGNDTSVAPINQLTTTYARTISQHAYTVMPTISAPVIYNPGTVITSQVSSFFSYANTIVNFESAAALYKSPGTLNEIKAAEGPNSLAQSAIIIISAAATLNPRPLIQTMIAQGVQAFYITYSASYSSLDAGLLNSLVAAVAAG